MGELGVADVRDQVALSLYSDFTNYTEFTPAPHHDAAVDALLGQVVSWSTALAGTRIRSTGYATLSGSSPGPLGGVLP